MDNELKADIEEVLDAIPDDLRGDNANDVFRLLERALAQGQWVSDETKDIVNYGRHVHVSNHLDDCCAECGHDLRHDIHLRKKKKPSTEELGDE